MTKSRASDTAKAEKNKSTKPKKQAFTEFARITSVWTGSPIAFGLASATIVVWLISGPVFHYSDTWQLVINTGTTIITFLMVFLIQNSQNRDSKMIQLKLDELIRAVQGAETRLINMDDMCEADLEALRQRYMELAHQAGRRLRPEDLKDVVEDTAEALISAKSKTATKSAASKSAPAKTRRRTSSGG